MLYCGLLAGVAAGNIAAHASGIDPLRTYAATLLLIGPALAGSRLLYVATHPVLCRSGLAAAWGRGRGGYCMYGGLPVGLVISIPVLRALRLNFGAFWDVASFTILVGMIFARIGCLLNGCCAGRACNIPLGMYLPGHSGRWERRIPTQILEALWAAVLLTGAFLLRPHLRVPGSLFVLVAAGYACGRFVLEFVREQEDNGATLTTGHWISLLIVVSSGCALAIR